MATKRLIDAKEVIRLLRGKWISKYPCSFYFGLIAAADEIEKLPTVDAVEVVHGKWVWDNRFHDYTCSICHNWDLKTPNYCSNCGAKMDGDGNG